MQTITLTDYANARDLPLGDAISQAVADGYTLNTHADPVSDGQTDAAEWYALEVAAVDASLVYLTVGDRTSIMELGDGSQIRFRVGEQDPARGRLVGLTLRGSHQ